MHDSGNPSIRTAVLVSNSPTRRSRPIRATPPLRKRPSSRSAALGALLVAFLLAAVAGTCFYLWQSIEPNRSAHGSYRTDAQVDGVVDDLPFEAPANPIDFAALRAEEPDAYAWIYVPGTDVDYPVLRHPADDSYYLDHNGRGEYAIEGSIYSETVNGDDFGDPVTVLYGHYLVNGTMFSSLHSFEDPVFFEEHDAMYVYLEDRVLTYRIVSAYETDDRHILKTNDFADDDRLRAYFDRVVDPEAVDGNVRQEEQVESDGKIVQLSTCTSPTEDTDRRYIVTGKLIDEQETR